MLDIEDYEYSGIPKKYLKEIADCLVSCGCDQPYDNEDDEYYYIDGTKYEFHELLEELDIPEKYYEKIYGTIKCPECGNELEEYSDICVDYNLGEKEKFTKALFDIKEKSKDKIDSFYKYLTKYPYLGANHKIGKEIIKGIDLLQTVTIENQIWYRARKAENSKVFSQKDMLPPPKSVNIPEGRFNHYGQSHFYLGESERLCGIEISSDKDCICWMQKIKIKKIDKILDLTKDIYEYPNEKDPIKITTLPLTIAGLLLSGKITNNQKKNTSWKPEYFVPRYIADICKEKGIKGILYPSSYCFGKDLVIFKFKKGDYEFIDDPYIYNYEAFNNLF